MPILLARHAVYTSSNGVKPQEAEKVGESIKWLQIYMPWVNLATAHIITSKHERTQQTAIGIAKVNAIPQEHITSDPRVFADYPPLDSDWKVSKEIAWALIMIREKLALIGTDTPLIIVGHAPSVWWIHAHIDPDDFLPYELRYKDRVDKIITFGSTFLIKNPQLQEY